MEILQPEKRVLVEEIMMEMEKRGFTEGEAEEFPEQLKRAIKRNNERFEKEKSFIVYKN